MTRKALEALFRHLWLVLLPAIAIPAIALPVAFVKAPPQYESRASIWVENPAYLQFSEKQEHFTSPANEQGTRLAELLKTRSFRTEVASRTTLAALAGTPKGDDELERRFKKNVNIMPSGEHLLVLRVQAESPAVAHSLSEALIGAYRDRATADRQTQAQAVIGFYEARLRTTTDLLSLDRVKNALETARYDYAVAEQGQEIGFQVVDPPTTPAQKNQLLNRPFLIVAIVSVVTGITLSALLLLALVRLDGSVRSVTDLAPSVPVIGVVPVLPAVRQSQLRRVALAPTLVGR
jgi:uncharacterized protein involved in exopolysaccharide biosynthesis